MNGWLADGPLPVEELAERAARAGLASAEPDADGFDALDDIVDLLERSDDYWTAHTDTDREVVVLVSTILETGMTFTHRLTEEEVDREAVDLMPDLSVIDWNSRKGLPLDDGSGNVGAEYLEDGPTMLTGPPGWMEACRPGDLLAFTRSDGILTVRVVAADDLGDGAAEIDALRDAAEGWIGDGRGEEEVPILMEAMARDLRLFRRPVPPVGELLVAAGLERRGHEWGWAGQAWRTRRERFEDHDARIRRRYRFNPCCDRAFDRVSEAYRASILTDATIDGRALAADLAHGSVAAALVAATSAPAAVAAFGRAVAGAAGGRRAAPALALAGLAELRAHNPEAAVEMLEAAVRADPDLPMAAGPLAALELDRGNLSRAHALAVRDDADPDLLEWVGAERARQASLRPMARRNDPCPCGSARKFKQCCAGGGPLTLGQRFPLVLQRVRHFATRPEGQETMFGLAISAAHGHEDLAAAIRRFIDDPFLVDVAIHEAGLGDDYLDERGALLAEDEFELLGMVLEAPLRLWEITDVKPGVSITVRDTATGEVLTAAERSGSQGREPGELLLARAVTVDDRPMLFGVPILVPLAQRARVLRMLDDWVDADELAAWFGSLFLPPRITNREGDELLLRRTTIEITGDIGAAVASLDATYDREGDDLVWHEMTVVDGHDRVVRGVLRLDDRTLVVESNSEERQARILNVLEELFEHVVVDDEDIDELDLDDDQGHGPIDLADAPEEVRALIEQHIIEYEDRWVDEAVPALGGLTPRQALDDPTRREDLLALLREMRGYQLPDGATGMSVERVERLLGIERS